MRIGIELGQLFPQRSGGIVQLVRGVCEQLFRLAPDSHFFIYRGPDNIELTEDPPSNVSVVSLTGKVFWEDLGDAAARDGIDLLFRTYPIEHPVGFPLDRQIVLVPDLQHELLPECFDAESLARRRAAFSPLIRGAGAIAVLAEHGRTVLCQRYPDARGEVFLLPPASSLSEVENTDTSFPPEVEAQLPASPFFLFPANLWPHKNHRRLFEAFARFLAGRSTPVALVLVGDPSAWDQLKAHCRDLPVHHLGFVSTATLAGLYRRCLALTFFSLYEGFGMPLLEAFQSGAPVICSNTSSLPEIGGDAVLSCDPTDVPGMAALMSRIADDAELRAELVRRGSTRPARYTWEGSAHGLLDACRRIMARPWSRAPVLEALAVLAERMEFYHGVARQRQDKITALSEETEARAKIITELHSVIAVLRGQLADLLATNEVLHTFVADQAKILKDLNTYSNAVQGELGQVRETLEGAWSCLPYRLVRKARHRWQAKATG
jgi:glycosyltransferase involved in cell wall biosynthesis